LLIVFGGDGTLNETINGLMVKENKIKLLYVPTGTVNDLGKYLYLPTNYKKAFKMLNSNTMRLDICKVNDAYFSYVLASGKFTNVSYGNNSSKYKRIFGRFYYYFRGIKDFFNRKYLNISINDRKMEKYSLILVLNIWRVGNFKIRGRKYNKVNDGSINVVLFKNTIFFGIFSLFLFLIFGIINKREVEVISGNNFKVKLLNKSQFNTDGEQSYNTNNLNILVIKEALEIYVSKKGVKKHFL
jgi:diacylglycerol kinase (ATP)